MIGLGAWLDYLEFRPRFKEDLHQSFHPIDWLDKQIGAGRIVGFYHDDSALLCETKDYPGGARVGTVFYALGDKSDILNILTPRAEQWAAGQGCTHIIVEGRLGWTRELRSRGYAFDSASSIKGL